MKLKLLISRMDIEILQNLLGRAAVGLISQLDNAKFNTTKLQGILCEMYSETALIEDKRIRNELVDLLGKDEIKDLCELLNLPANTDDIYQQLKNTNISVTNRATFYQYFEIENVEENTVKPPNAEKVKAQYLLFDHQITAAISVMDLLRNKGKHRAVLHMPTGSGKTRTAMHVIANYLCLQPQKTVIWLAYSEELCEQAAEEFIKSWQYLGNRNTDVYRFWGCHNIDNLDNIKDGLIVAGLPKMVGKAKKSIEFMQKLSKNTSLVVIDEAHQAIAHTYSAVLDLLAPINKDGTPHLMGLTATPGRTWLDIDQDEELSDFFFKQIYSLSVDGFDSPIKYLVGKGYLAKTTFEPLLSDFGNDLTEQDIEKIKNNVDIPQDILKKIAEDSQRNILIVQKIMELSKEAKRIIVFASTVEHSKLLSSILHYKGINAKSITGDTPTQDRVNIINEYKDNNNDPMVICNYAVLTTGFDAPKTSVAVIARPTASLVLYSQMVGRAIRGVKAGGNKNAKVVTVVDKKLGGFGDIAEAFNNWNDVWESK